jgi:ribosome assembly protein 4
LSNNLYLLEGSCLNTLTSHTNDLYALTLLPNGLLASGSSDTKIMIWNITKTSPLYTLTGHTNWVRALVVINAEYLVSGAEDNKIILWSLTNNYAQVKSWQASSKVLSLAFDSTLNVLASGDVNSANNVKLWDSSLWANLGKLSDHFSFL